MNKDLDKDQLQAELEKIKEQVAVKNGLYHGTVYWEEIKEEN
ncbi:RNA 2'-phosphotransferase [Mucilaginibacter sp. MD40]|nr:RNA 2'-phosphotransferase [Mucilaginibacter sp. MD40]